MEYLVITGIIAGSVFLVLFIVLSIVARLYRKATKEMAFVRTGLGGEKVISNGGAFVIRMFHDTIPVNMKTLRLVVTRREKQSLITKDKIRVDVQAEFYLRVRHDAKSIATAAQTLGNRTQDPEALKELIEGKFVDALRSVSAEMEMNELHEKRSDFVQKVQNACASDLEKNGLELESVSLTALDQTNLEHFDPNNAFDAQGLTKITKTIEDNRKAQNDVTQSTEVLIAQRNLDSTKEKIEVEKAIEYAKLQQREEIASRVAQQEAQVASIESEQKRKSEEARIEAEKRVQEANLERERHIKEIEIGKDIAISEKRQAQAVAEGRARETEIAARLSVEEAELAKERTIREARINNDITISQKSQEHSRAEALVKEELAKAVIAEERVATSREVEIANRQKQIELIAAQKDAETEALRLRLAAKAKAEAAELEAQAILKLAEAEAVRYQTEAEGRRRINEAENTISKEQIELRARLALIEAMPRIIAESVKPIEKIQSLRVVDVQGLSGMGTGGTGTAGAGGNGAQDLVNAALRYRSQSTLLGSLLGELGLGSGSLDDLTRALETKPVADQSTDAPADGKTSEK